MKRFYLGNSGLGDADNQIELQATLWNRIESYAEYGIAMIPNFLLALVVLLLTWVVARGVSIAVRRAFQAVRIRRALVDLITTLAKIAIWIVGLLMACVVLFPSVQPSNLLAALGLGSVAIGLAFKDIFENFLAGVMILLRKPMRIGDHIECQGVEGRVEEITIRDTYLRQLDQQLVLIPNAFIYGNPVKVRTDKKLRRYELIVGVAYKEDLDEAKELLIEAMQGLEYHSKKHEIEVFARELNASSVDFTIRWWAGSEPVDFHESRDLVVRTIKAALDEADIEIPFPHRTLTFDQLPVVELESS